MIFNRKKQLSALEKLYNSNESEAVVFYSTIDSDLHDILDEFLKDKAFFYYKAVQVSAEEQLNLFINSINEQLPKSNISDRTYYGAIKAMIDEKCEKRVIIIDEFQNIIKFSTSLIDEILKCVNNKWDNQPVLFVFLSTNSYFVENQMVDKLKEYAYEISGLIKLPDLTFMDIIKRFEKYSKIDQIITYAILGGKGKRISSFKPELSLKDNIINSILSDDGYLYNRGLNILPPELREHNVYNTILVNIAKGLTKLNDLHKVTGYSRAKVSVYINNLIEHNLIEKIDSFDTDGKDNTLKGIYKIKDSFLLFFYRFVFPNLSMLSASEKEKFYKKYIAPYLEDFAADTFRKVCVEYIEILDRLEKMPFKITDMGTWIGKVGNIDIICTDNSGHTLIGLCEFKKSSISYEDFEWLKFCAMQAKLSVDMYYLFTKNKFDDKLVDFAKEAGNVLLVDSTML